MSDCTKVKGFLSKYFKDELDKKKRQYVERHVKNCIMCSAEMEFAKKRVSVTELLVSLQPRPSFFKRISNAPQRIKQKIKKAFSKHPVALPAMLILLFSFIPAGLYVKRSNIPFKKTDEARDVVQVAQDAKKPAEPIAENKPASANPVQLKIGKKIDEKAEPKKEAVKNEKLMTNLSEKAKETDFKKQGEKIDKKKTDVSKTEQAAVNKKSEENIKQGLFRLTLKSDLQSDIVFSKIESLSENSGAVILSTKGFMPDSIEKKEILVRISKEKYEGFLKGMRNQFTDVLSVADKNIKLSNDITRQEEQSFVLIEIN
jgi:G3E family GTPase